MTSNVRLQRLYDFTVQIRRTEDDAVAGTGFAVSNDGKVVTTVQVATAALGVHPRQASDKEVGVYFPQARDGEERRRRATVAACLPLHDDDLVLLQLTGGPPPLGPEQIAVLGRAERSPYHPFRSYGYRRLDGYVAGHAHGTILDFVQPLRQHRYRSEPLQLESGQLRGGMSGGAVLDFKRNLVIGIVSEAKFPTLAGPQQGAGWAVNSRLLMFEPFSLPVQLEDLPKSAALEPEGHVEATGLARGADLGVAWNDAPPSLREWVGRSELLQDISLDWDDREHSVTGLIGPGGEGKTSLARRWLDDLMEDPLQARFDGVFWWSFGIRPSPDEFFEAALGHFSGSDALAHRVPSATVRARILGGLLGKGRYIFVLDGLEAVQEQKGDRYGLVRNADLRDFLAYFAGGEHRSFCLITSRIPVLDLMEYSAYIHRDVAHLTSDEGRALLREVGVIGSAEAAEKLVGEWGAHALTLSLLGAYLSDLYAGDVEQLSRLLPPEAGAARQTHVGYMLSQYDEHLTVAERAFLMVFSAFRIPVGAWAFERVFRADMGPKALNMSVSALDERSFRALLRRLVARRIVRYCPRVRSCTIHPLIRSHYASLASRADPRQVQDLHKHIKDYYLRLAEDLPAAPSLRDLAPAIEATHHACRAGAHDQAYRIYDELVQQGRRSLIARELEAHETDLALMREFFPHGDTSREPQLAQAQHKRLVLNEMALCLRNMGRLPESVPFYERTARVAADMQDWPRASSICRTVVDLNCHVGRLTAATEMGRRALTLAGRSDDKGDQRNSLYRQAWAAHLSGQLKTAASTFKQAEALEREINPTVRYLYGLRGIHHASHLLRTGDAKYARRIMEANLEICEGSDWLNSLSLCHRVLGDLEADDGDHDAALLHYDEAIRIAHQIGRRDVLIDVQLARGRWHARHRGNAGEALTDLIPACESAAQTGYYLHEADIRVAIAWAHLAAKDPAAARAQADRARHMSSDMGYHWGQVDAEELLEELNHDGGGSGGRR
jgi:tetratricopeptide (TPR) repeat protein